MSKRHITVAALLAAAGLAPAAARATYPGHNGQIVFPMGGGSVELYTVSPDGSDGKSSGLPGGRRRAGGPEAKEGRYHT